jgi:capsular polysaccharide biosynthesis protein
MGDQAPPDLRPGDHRVTLAETTTTAGAGAVVWTPGQDVPVAAILNGEIFSGILDATGWPAARRRALLLSLFPALDFAGDYTIRLAPADNAAAMLDPALQALGLALATGAIKPSRGGLVNGQSDRAYIENMTEAVAFGPGTVTLRKSSSEGGPMRFMRAVGLEDFPGATSEEVVPAESYLRSPPLVLDNPGWLAPRLVEAVARGGETARAGRIAILRNALVVGDGVVHDGAGRILAESLQNVRRERIIPHFYRLDTDLYASLGWQEAEQSATEDHLVLLKQHYDGNFGHWIMETLPRIGLVGERYPLERCRVMVMGWYQPAIPLFRESLRWCGISDDRLIISTNAPIRMLEAIFPVPISDPPWVFAPYAIRFLEGLATRVQAAHPVGAAAAPERIYLSRNRFGKRVLLNEDEVTEFLVRRGYRVLHPEQLSFTEQVIALSRARYVAGNMGAALTNAVFAPRGVRMLALATEHMPDDFFWDITAQKGGRYISLHGQATDPERHMQSDFTIDMERLRRVFAEFDPGD